MTEQSLLNPDRQPSPAGVERAAAKIAKILPVTPLLPLEVDGTTIWCKAECLQPIGAFKLRGGWHRLSDLDEEQRKKGVVAFSSGNHAQGVAFSARRLGCRTVIVMPITTPTLKSDAVKALGGDVVLHGESYSDAHTHALELAEQQQLLQV